MVSAPSPYMTLIAMFVALFFYVIPIIFAVLLVVSHIKLHSSLKLLHKKIDAMNESAVSAASPS